MKKRASVLITALVLLSATIFTGCGKGGDNSEGKNSDLRVAVVCSGSGQNDNGYNQSAYVVRECVATNSDVVNEVHLTDIDKYLGHVVDMETLFKMLDDGQL